MYGDSSLSRLPIPAEVRSDSQSLFSVRAMSVHALKILSSASSTTSVIFTSSLAMTVHNGLTQPWSIKYWICLVVPPEVAFATAHVASRFDFQSPSSSTRSKGGINAESNTDWM